MQWAYHLVLPWITFALLFSAIYVRMIRANVMDTLGEDYVRTARAKGAPEQQVMRNHVLRNALLPIVTMLGMDIGIALGGAIFTETIFGLPGLGRLAVQALENFDLPMIQGVVVFSTLCIIVFSVAVDIAYAWIDPRIRLGVVTRARRRARPCARRAGTTRRPRGTASRSQSRQRCCTCPQSTIPLTTIFSTSRVSVRRSSLIEVAEEPLDGLRARSRDTRRAPRALRRELERDDAGVLPLPPAHEPVLLEPVDEPYRARVGQPEHACEVIDGAATVDPQRRQRGRAGGRVAGGLCRRRLHRVRERNRHGAEDVLETQVARRSP